MKTIFKREFVIEQHRKKKTRSEILKMEKDLNLNAMFIKRTLDCYAETKDVNDCPRQGQPWSQRTKNPLDNWQKSTIHQSQQCIQCAKNFPCCN